MSVSIKKNIKHGFQKICTKENLIKLCIIVTLMGLHSINILAASDSTAATTQAEGTDIVVSFNELFINLFKLVRGIFITSACFVSIVALLRILFGDDKEGPAGVRRLKIIAACVLGAWLIPYLYKSIYSVLKSRNSGVNDVKDLTGLT